MTSSSSENQANGNLAKRIAAGAGMFVLLALSVEGGVRLDDWARWRTPFWSPDASMADLIAHDTLGVHPRAGAQFNKWKINSVGTRGPELNPSLSDRRIIILGASETFGQAESANREYPRQLQDSLERAGCRVEVLNAAFPGMSLPTVEQDFRLRLSSLHPRAVVYYPTPQQYLDEEPPRPATMEPLPTSTKGSLTFKSRFVARARNQIKGMLPVSVQHFLRRRDIEKSRDGKPTDWLFTRQPLDRLDAFENDLRRLVGTVRAANSSILLLSHANAFVGHNPKPVETLTAWVRFYPRAVGSVLVDFDSVAALRIARVAADSGVAFVDPWHDFHAVDASVAFADFSHFTDLGAAHMAALLRGPLLNLVDCQIPPQ